MANLRPWATRDENKKKLKDTTSKTKSFFASRCQRHMLMGFRGCASWELSRRDPQKTAIVKRELTFTRPSRAEENGVVWDFRDRRGCGESLRRGCGFDEWSECQNKLSFWALDDSLADGEIES
ncbi:Uncharacterized protein Fot_21717 [Forsythia ovata]|uniref:Uncharacterized protein n=1 Tax=Forsythia ovata TaxID=205694 RepID=A0ABD1UW11_9LAMI